MIKQFFGLLFFTLTRTIVPFRIPLFHPLVHQTFFLPYTFSLESVLLRSDIYLAFQLRKLFFPPLWRDLFSFFCNMSAGLSLHRSIVQCPPASPFRSVPDVATLASTSLLPSSFQLIFYVFSCSYDLGPRPLLYLETFFCLP